MLLARAHESCLSPPMPLGQCLELAVLLERAGALFYARAANELAEQPVIRELLLSLADDERVHEDQFETLRALAPDNHASVTTDYLKALTIHRFFSGPEAPLRLMPQARSVRQVLSLALQFERETLEAFVQLRAAIQHAQGLELLDAIIETERIHVLRVGRWV